MAKRHDGTKVRVIIGKIQLLKGVAGIALQQHAPQLLLANSIKVIVAHLKIAQSGVGHKPLREERHACNGGWFQSMLM